MISFLNGTIAAKNENGVIVDVGGVGYSVSMPVSDIAKMGSIGDSIKVFTHFHISENMVGLFGFLTGEQIDYFNKLIAISGIGPKAAVSILGTLSVQDLAFAIIAEDVKAITRAPGVGPKAAQRIILELKEKVGGSSVELDFSGPAVTAPAVTGNNLAMANAALQELGYSPAEIATALKGADSNASTEELIRHALRAMVMKG